MKSENKQLIILGMHRSGTSLLSSWLHKCGLNLGNNLMSKGVGNPHGHFEDWDFVQYHNDILRFNNLPYFISSKEKIELNSYYIKRSEHIIGLKNDLHSQWGWKDPRTCLFLDIWSEKLPDAKYVIVFRDYLTCVDSLIRRDVKQRLKKLKIPLKYQFIKNYYIQKEKKNILKNPKKINKYIKTWIKHNKNIINELKNLNNDNYIVVENTLLDSASENIFKTLTINWGFNLSYSKFSSVYDDTLMKDDTSFNIDLINEDLIEECNEIMKSLKKMTNK